MAENASEMVVASKLEAEFLPGCVKHTMRISDSSRLPAAEELWDIEPTIGRGTFGVVRFERRRLPTSSPGPSFALLPHARAVKQISKTIAEGKRWNYMKELEAIVKFSQPRYAPYFVQSQGWFEDDESIFIAMDYFPLGDLRRFMDTKPPFSEESTRQIIRQLLEGIRFMHDSGYAHRDLKPGNILVASHSPRWVVKIADFGISKQAMEGGTHLRTMHIGTFGWYVLESSGVESEKPAAGSFLGFEIFANHTRNMAPEILGFFSGGNPAVAYSVSVDIWAIGVIATELLLKQHPFPNVSDLVSYVHGVSPLNFEGVAGYNLSEPCRQFISGLLTPNPVTRPRAGVAVTHMWLAEAIPDSDESDEESLFVREDPTPRDLPMRARDAVTPASLPSLAWSNLQLTDGSQATQSTVTLLNTYNGPEFDSRLLLPCFQNLWLETTKHFVLRSDNPIDIETSVAHGVWTSSQRVNKILEKGYKRAAGRVLLFFSVIKSQKFCGVARMTSEMDWLHTDEHWVEDSWQGRFTLDWLCLTELPFEGVRRVPVKPETPGFRAISCYDGTEIAATSAFELLRAFSARERELLPSVLTPPGTVTPMDVDTQLPSLRPVGDLRYNT